MIPQNIVSRLRSFYAFVLMISFLLLINLTGFLWFGYYFSKSFVVLTKYSDSKSNVIEFHFSLERKSFNEENTFLINEDEINSNDRLFDVVKRNHEGGEIIYTVIEDKSEKDFLSYLNHTLNSDQQKSGQNVKVNLNLDKIFTGEFLFSFDQGVVLTDFIWKNESLTGELPIEVPEPPPNLL